MKFKRLCGVALVAAIGTTVVGPVAAGATNIATELESSGTVTVTQGGIDTPNTDLGDPEDDTSNIVVPDTDINENQDTTGSLTLMRTTNYNFNLAGPTGSATTLQNTGQLQSLYASPVTVEIYDRGTLPTDPGYSTTEVTRGALVQFGDIDANATTGTTTVSAELSTQFTSSTSAHTLEGATITFSNGLLATQTVGAATPTTFNTGFTLSEGVAQTVVVNNAANKGIYTAEFGQSAGYNETANSLGYTGNADTDSSSVMLTVPAATTGGMDVGADYTAVVTWSIARTA
ncbi:WxL domain-containing protein [Enterococcus sp. HY326]|uniref:WxL domain-containing protein n=1 Tax=Enterococcus sp. HY326 TaxID=2971265 RepID=UPI0022408907|nr:WxL domain-containing protein [Enterococcus sp. HY326]